MSPKLNMKLEDPPPSQLHMTTAFAWILTVSLHPAYTCIGCKEAKQFVIYSDFGNVYYSYGLHVVIVDLMTCLTDM